ncbi:DNA polymerase III subunit delta' [Candidatus Omnitrophota bacterium]
MSFKDIKGHARTIERLKGYRKSGTLAGAYLFSGPEGVGKALAARAFAKSVNCLEAGVDSCDRCISCKRIDNAQHPDVYFIEPSEKGIIKIEYIRELKKRIALKPYEAKFKVFIINEAQRMNAEAQNALLKVLEEPPAHSLIILVSSKPALLFGTIISRCQVVKFSPLTRDCLKSVLQRDYRLDSVLAHFLAYSCEGRIGSALNLKDRDALGEKNAVIDAFDLPRRPPFDTLSIADRSQARRHLNTLSLWFRDIYLAKSGIEHSQIINIDRKAELLKLPDRYSWDELDEILNSISDSILYLEQNINLKLLLSNLQAQLWKARS